MTKYWPGTERLMTLDRKMARVARVKALLDFLDKAAGPGWPHRMEMKDKYWDQDLPRLWRSGRYMPIETSVLKLEAYAERFGYRREGEKSQSPAVSADVVALLESL